MFIRISIDILRRCRGKPVVPRPNLCTPFSLPVRRSRAAWRDSASDNCCPCQNCLQIFRDWPLYAAITCFSSSPCRPVVITLLCESGFCAVDDGQNAQRFHGTFTHPFPDHTDAGCWAAAVTAKIEVGTRRAAKPGGRQHRGWSAGPAAEYAGGSLITPISFMVVNLIVNVASDSNAIFVNIIIDTAAYCPHRPRGINSTFSGCH